MRQFEPDPALPAQPAPAKPKPRPALPFLLEDLGDLKLFKAAEEADEHAAEPDSILPKPEPELGLLTTDDLAAARHKVSITRADRWALLALTVDPICIATGSVHCHGHPQSCNSARRLPTTSDPTHLKLYPG